MTNCPFFKVACRQIGGALVHPANYQLNVKVAAYSSGTGGKSINVANLHVLMQSRVALVRHSCGGDIFKIKRE